MPWDDLDLDPVTLILKLNLDIVKMYHHTKNEVSMSIASKVITWTDTQTDRHTNTTKTLPLPHTREVIKQLHKMYIYIVYYKHIHVAAYTTSSWAWFLLGEISRQFHAEKDQVNDQTQVSTFSFWASGWSTAMELWRKNWLTFLWLLQPVEWKLNVACYTNGKCDHTSNQR